MVLTQLKYIEFRKLMFLNMMQSLPATVQHTATSTHQQFHWRFISDTPFPKVLWTPSTPFWKQNCIHLRVSYESFLMFSQDIILILSYEHIFHPKFWVSWGEESLSLLSFFFFFLFHSLSPCLPISQNLSLSFWQSEISVAVHLKSQNFRFWN